MAIVKMSKFNLFSFDYDRQRLMDHLQKFEYVHFNDLQENEDERLKDEVQQVRIPERLVEINEDIVKAQWAIDFLEKHQQKQSSLKALIQGKKTYSLEHIAERANSFDFEEHYEVLNRYSEEISENNQEIQNLKGEIEELHPWRSIDIKVQDLKQIQRVKTFTGTIPEKFYPNLQREIKDLEECYLEMISYTDKFYYILGIATKEEASQFLDILRGNGYTPVEIKSEGLVPEKIQEYKKIIETKKEDNKKVEQKVVDYLRYLEDFQIYHDAMKNRYLKEASTENFLKTDTIDIIEGFVPTDLVDEFENRVKDTLGTDYYLTVKDADRDDPDVPIILKNNKFAKAFESLTKMYSLPRYNEIDPTPLFAPFYAFFAGMMVGDLGYGLIGFIATIIGNKVFNLDEDKKNLLRFFMYLSLMTMFWGAIYGSFFGGLIELPALLDTNKDYIPIMLISLGFALIHLFFSVGIDAYMKFRDGKPLDALFDDILWYILLIGVIILVAEFLGNGLVPPMVQTIAKWMAIIAALGIILTGGRDSKSIGGKIGGGIYSLYNISGWLGDFVSYLRLMALGLASAFIGVAINIIVEMMMDSNIIIGLAGILIFVVFHLFNMFLAYLSAYVHSARLTYVEMFNKFYEGGGKPFKSLVESSDYFTIKNESRRKK
ncbi:MAG: V-type ATP synthase subunit I [Tissierellia bacterium]|nr:V-type ATP synthase subunit I [Tissierellia bacterium]